MQTPDHDAPMQESDANAPPANNEEGDTKEQGYRICLDVTPDGYEVSGPEPLPAEPQEGDTESEAQPLPDLTTAIKHVLAIVKENPVAQDEQQAFKGATSSMGHE